MKQSHPSALLTDLYEITMLQGYFEQQMNQTAVFELFVRNLPPQRNFLMAAGLAQVLSYLADLHFDRNDLAWLRSYHQFRPAFINSLEHMRFTGDVDALPEGSIFFQDEPLIRITAPLREAQFIESRLINLLHYQTLVASKAVRVTMAAGGKRLIDFGLRRAHGAEAGLLSARASYIAGFDGTATALAAPQFDIPVFGTMAHSFVQAHEHESLAFIAFARAFPQNATLLIDTYDTDAAAQQVARLARTLATEENIHIQAVRIDSGDLGVVAQRVRQILDAGGGRGIQIFASGNLDEYAVQTLMKSGAPIDGFGVGTRMNTSADAPYLDCAYKMVEYAAQARRKRSTGKVTLPGRKQVFRQIDKDGMMCGDTLALDGEQLAGKPLLVPVMRGGRLLEVLPTLEQIRVHARAQLASLPSALHSLESAKPYPVKISQRLHALAELVDQQQRIRAATDYMN